VLFLSAPSVHGFALCANYMGRRWQGGHRNLPGWRAPGVAAGI
jgi:hypothetical protein